MAGHRRAEATPFFERLCPAIHAFPADSIKDVDARHKAGHDEWVGELPPQT
jgi:hypothetical protein